MLTCAITASYCVPWQILLNGLSLLSAGWNTYCIIVVFWNKLFGFFYSHHVEEFVQITIFSCEITFGSNTNQQICQLHNKKDGPEDACHIWKLSSSVTKPFTTVQNCAAEAGNEMEALTWRESEIHLIQQNIRILSFLWFYHNTWSKSSNILNVENVFPNHWGAGWHYSHVSEW